MGVGPFEQLFGLKVQKRARRIVLRVQTLRKNDARTSVDVAVLSCTLH